MPDDLHVIGLTADEADRIERFEENEPDIDIDCEWILADEGITKDDCYKIIQRAGIELPMMYRLGFNNNNCIGCVKGGMGYWNKIRQIFPDQFNRMARQERKQNVAINKRYINGRRVKVFLDELDPNAGRDVPEPNIDCGVLCEGLGHDLVGIYDPAEPNEVNPVSTSPASTHTMPTRQERASQQGETRMMPYHVKFESDDKSVAIHVTVDERVEDEYVDGDQFLRDVLAGFEDTFGKSWDEGIELGTSSNGLNCPTVIFSMPGGLGDLVGIIGLHGNYDSVFRGFIEEAVEKAHAEAMERRREVIRAELRPTVENRLAEAVLKAVMVLNDNTYRSICESETKAWEFDRDNEPMETEIVAGVMSNFMMDPLAFMTFQLRAPMPESAATPAALSTAKMYAPMAPHKLTPVKVDEAEPEPNGPTDPTGGEGDDDVPLDEVLPKQAEAEAEVKPAPSPETEPDAPEVDEAELREFHAGRAGNAGEWIALVAARGTVTLTEAAEALGTTTKALGGITGGVTRASRSSGVYVPIDTIESDGERAWTWTGPDMDLGWTEPKPIDEAEDPEVGTAPPTVPDAPSVDEAEPEPNGPTDPTGGDDRQTDITDFIEPGATANDPEVANVDVVEAEIITGSIDEAEPEPNSPTTPDFLNAPPFSDLQLTPAEVRVLTHLKVKASKANPIGSGDLAAALDLTERTIREIFVSIAEKSAALGGDPPVEFSFAAMGYHLPE